MPNEDKKLFDDLNRKQFGRILDALIREFGYDQMIRFATSADLRPSAEERMPIENLILVADASFPGLFDERVKLYLARKKGGCANCGTATFGHLCARCHGERF